jgi:hypothetical protein
MRKLIFAVVFPIGLLACWPVGPVYAQALPNINLLSVRYNSLKTAAKPDGELKTEIDDVDKAIADARRTGNLGEVRRQIAKGLALLNKDAWTPQLDYRKLAGAEERAHGDRFGGALRDAHRADLSAIDRSEREHYDEGSDQEACATRASRRGRPAGAVPHELGTFDGVSRDLRETPFAIELDLAGVEDGAQVIEAEIFDGTASLGAANLSVFVHKGLDAKLKSLEAAGATAAAAVRADVLFPGRLHQEREPRPHRAGRISTSAPRLRARRQSWRNRRAVRIRSRARPATSSVTMCSRARTKSCRIASTCRRVTSQPKPRRS